jgi:hypothetical protein
VIKEFRIAADTLSLRAAKMFSSTALLRQDKAIMPHHINYPAEQLAQLMHHLYLEAVKQYL